MAGTFKSTGGSAIMQLFEEPPNLIAKAAVEAVITGGDIASAIVSMASSGYSNNAHKFFKSGRDKYTEGLPTSTMGSKSLNPRAIEDVVLSEAKTQISREADRYTDLAESIKYGNKAEYDDAINWRNYARNLANTLTVSDITVLENKTPSLQSLFIHSVYNNVGLFYPVAKDNIIGSELFINSLKGSYPKVFIESITYHDYDPNLLSVRTREVSRDNSIKYVDADLNYLEVNDDKEYLTIKYKVPELNTTDFAEFTMVILADDPAFYEKYYEGNNYSYFPIVSIRENKTNMTNKVIDGNPVSEKGFTGSNALKELSIDMNEMLSSVGESDGAKDIDDAYVGMFANFTSDKPEMIKYNMKFFEALRTGEIGDSNYHDLTYIRNELAIQDPKFEAAWPSIYYGSQAYVAPPGEQPSPWVDGIYMPQNLDAVDLTYEYGINVKHTEEHSYETGYFYFFTLKTRYIYAEIRSGTTGPIGYTQIVLEGGNFSKGETLEVDGYVMYTLQLTSTTYKVVIVMMPQVSFSNWWYGRAETVFHTTYALNGHSRREDDPVIGYPDLLEWMVIPLNYELVKDFNNRVETVIYYDSCRIVLFSVQVVFTAGWKKFLKALLYIILIVIIILTWGATAPLLIAVGAAAQVALIVSAVIAIVVRIITAVAGAMAGAIAGAALGIVAVIFSLGTNWSTLIASTIKLTLALLGAVTQIASSITKIVLTVSTMKLLESTEDILSDTAEEQKKVDELEEGLDGNEWNPLTIGFGFIPDETPDQFYSKRLNTAGITDLGYLVTDFTRNALMLPEPDYTEYNEGESQGIKAYINQQQRR